MKAVDLFAGAGGTSTGLTLACAELGVPLDLTAVNHWPTAVETHAINHPDARHLCESIDNLDPRKVISGRLDLLWASPECTHHSRARGGKPISDQSRATAWCVVRWADALRPRWIGVENVMEFAEWAPLGANGKPLKSKRGEIFRAWVSALQALGYRVEWRELCAADFGAATTRRRLYVLARFDGGRARGPITWPIETHAQADIEPSLFGPKATWRAAREVIDWSLTGRSIFGRPKPLAENTLKRIAAGARKFWGLELEPFLVSLRGTGAGQIPYTALRLDQPLPTITASGSHLGIVQPFVLGQQSGSAARPVSQPVMTLSQGGAVSLIEPFVVSFYGAGEGVNGLREPLRTLTTRDRFGIVAPAHLDVTFRMLRVHEGAAAMGFPTGYRFAGTMRDQMAQVGNAVEVNQARALAAVMVRDVMERKVA